MISLIIIARLLEYPSEELWEHCDELFHEAMQANELTNEHKQQLLDTMTALLKMPFLDAQADYCTLFDRGRSTSLLLFEHVHAESRDRGQAMVDLMAQYEAAGLSLNSRELPDFLPLYLEFLAHQPHAKMLEGLQNIVPILALLAARLHQRQSHYATLFDVLISLTNSEVNTSELQDKVASEARDDTPEALDAVWQEEQITFMGDAGCSTSEQTQHQRRFAGAVTPQYLNVEALHTAGSCGD
ncbi:nitrate reductase molybdenum cofactor assembly chaperone [Shewanella sp.]|uniref:nitrate reductase molybdenum cofactor assembly chaperone n=1 Tax=Shewanella sp. TaxID=50422 RepID=UPI003A969B75